MDPTQAIAVLVDAVWYAQRYPDVPEAEALRHFAAHGLAEGRDPNAFFDGAWYAREYPQVAESGLPPLLHYMQTGAASLLDPHPRFDAAWYARQHPQARGNPLLYHLTTGAAHGWPTELATDYAAFPARPETAASGHPVHLVITGDDVDASPESGAWLLRVTSRGLDLSVPGYATAHRLPPDRIADLVRVLADAGVERVDIRHVPEHPFDLRGFLHALDVPFDFTLQDYFVICPQRYLLPWPDAQYCGEPGPADCNACIAARPRLGATDILTWRRSHDWLFRAAGRVICPSLDALARLQRHGLAGRVVVLASTGGPWKLAMPKITPRGRLRVAVFGAETHKGAAALASVQETSSRPEIDIQILAAGDHPADRAAALHKARPHVVWLPTQWPDPRSDGLDAAIAAGLPIVAANIGAFPERLAGRRLTWLVDPGAPAQTWLDAFAAVRTALLGDTPKPGRRARSGEIHAVEVRPAAHRPSGLMDLRRPGRVSVVVLPERFGNGTPTPCGSIRLLQPLDHLAAAGAIDLVLADPAEALRYQADLFVTQRYAVDTGTADALAAHCRAHAIRLLYDLDDDLLNIPRDHPEAVILRPRAKLVARMLGHADAVWVSTEALRLALGAAGQKARVVANGLDERIWSAVPSRSPVSRGPLRILYMGTATHDADFAIVAPALARLHTVFGDRVRMEIIGVTTQNDLPAGVHRLVPPQHARASYPGFVDWMLGQTQVAQPWDIGIAPLADNAFNRCKSAIKALDYAALGLSVLASDVPAYRGSAATLVANTEADWFAALARLVRDPRLRLSQARASHESFVQNGTLIAQAPIRQAELLAAAARRVSPSRRGRGQA